MFWFCFFLFLILSFNVFLYVLNSVSLKRLVESEYGKQRKGIKSLSWYPFFNNFVLFSLAEKYFSPTMKRYKKGAYVAFIIIALLNLMLGFLTPYYAVFYSFLISTSKLTGSTILYVLFEYDLLHKVVNFFLDIIGVDGEPMGSLIPFEAVVGTGLLYVLIKIVSVPFTITMFLFIPYIMLIYSFFLIAKQHSRRYWLHFLLLLVTLGFSMPFQLYRFSRLRQRTVFDYK